MSSVSALCNAGKSSPPLTRMAPPPPPSIGSGFGLGFGFRGSFKSSSRRLIQSGKLASRYLRHSRPCRSSADWLRLRQRRPTDRLTGSRRRPVRQRHEQQPAGAGCARCQSAELGDGRALDWHPPAAAAPTSNRCPLVCAFVLEPPIASWFVCLPVWRQRRPTGELRSHKGPL